MICVEAVEEADLSLDCCGSKVTLAVYEVAVSERLGAVTWLHWIDEAGLFVVAEIR